MPERAVSYVSASSQHGRCTYPFGSFTLRHGFETLFSQPTLIRLGAVSQTNVYDTISGLNSEKLNHIRSLISNATANRTILTPPESTPRQLSFGIFAALAEFESEF